MPIEIPNRYIPGMSKIRLLSDEEADQLIATLSAAPLTQWPSELAEKIGGAIPTISSDDLKEIVVTLYALNQARETSEIPTVRFISELMASMRNSGDPALEKMKKDEALQLKERLKRLLSINSVALVAKALHLQRDGERLYCDAKILSDIRTVFSEDVNASPSCAVIGHTLKLGYHENGDHKQFFLVLDGSDLNSLLKVLERAKSKEETLRQLLTQAGVKDLSA